MRIQKLASNVLSGDDKQTLAALEEIKKLPDHELHFYLVLRDTLQATSQETRKAITLAQVEAERRADARVRNLTMTSTVASGLMGLAGVILGAYLMS